MSKPQVTTARASLMHRGSRDDGHAVEVSDRPLTIRRLRPGMKDELLLRRFVNGVRHKTGLGREELKFLVGDGDVGWPGELDLGRQVLNFLLSPESPLPALRGRAFPPAQ